MTNCLRRVAEMQASRGVCCRLLDSDADAYVPIPPSCAGSPCRGNLPPPLVPGNWRKSTRTPSFSPIRAVSYGILDSTSAAILRSFSESLLEYLWSLVSTLSELQLLPVLPLLVCSCRRLLRTLHCSARPYLQ